MHTTWNTQQQSIRDQFKEIGQAVSARSKELRASYDVDTQSWQQIADAGMFGFPVSKKDGGSGQTWWEFAAALEGLASTAGDLGFLLSIIAHMGAVKLLSEHGTTVQKARYLPKILGGSIASTATTESTGGSDVSRINTAANLEGNKMVLRGRKAHITNAPVADVIIVLGRIPSLGKKRDITLFLFERGQVGLSTAERERAMGNQTSPTGDIHLDGIEITDEHILGTSGDGLSALYSMLTLDRLLYALVAAGYLEPLVERSIRRVQTRETFGRKLGEHQYVQDKVVLLKVAMEEARFLSYAALDRMIQNTPDAIMTASIAKLVGTERLWSAAYEYLQLHGHSGYLDPGIHNVVSDAIATRIAGGTSEMQKVNIFNQLLKLQAGQVEGVKL